MEQFKQCLLTMVNGAICRETEKWWTEYKEFEVAKVWWKAEIIMEKLLYLRKFGEM